MANIYLLNLIFSKPAGSSSANGLFNSDSSSARSKVWYTIPATNWPSGGAPAQGSQLQQSADQANWGTPTPDKSTLGCELGEDVYIRMVPDSSWGSDVITLRWSAVFGRAATSNHGDATIASPFVLSNAMPCTLYTTDFSAPGPDGSWIFYLGALTQNAAGQNGQNPVAGRKCTYAFIDGATVADGVVWYTFGHDPEMDVSG